METIFTNARVITRDREFAGSVVIANGKIAAVEPGRSTAPGAIDLDGDYLTPGLVELHTDNLEKHFAPRPGVKWPGRAAVMAHDAQIAAAGITTVFDALAIGDVYASSRVEGLEEMHKGLCQACESGLLRADHRLHLRCELSFAQVLELFEQLMDGPLVQLVSIMDHTPGQRQFVSVDKYRLYYQKKHGMSDDEFEAFLARRREVQAKYSAVHRRALVERARARHFVLASHDDATLAHVTESADDGMTIAEFPTTLEAARASREHGLAILLGAPNVVLGGSQSGNISALDLAAEGLLDIVSSDYVPMSLMQAPFVLAKAGFGLDLPGAIRLASYNPARAVGLDDRGEIAPGKRADLARVRVVDEMPVVRAVWRDGARVV
ncbi:MAG TPA: alpha-D-ribose 1-methylphosphonate 5-triphosphate diphosphatase [Alphaproteobacteria bacterium]|nr:alpha-D-ribose 1-methylphosphonate 5-triphosphate diphosphatase [Alphaproteobacteria bacterium]